jgi:hypothetical protein
MHLKVLEMHSVSILGVRNFYSGYWRTKREITSMNIVEGLEYAAASPGGLIAYILLIAAFAFRWWLNRHAIVVRHLNGVSKRDLPALIRLLALGMPDELTPAHERVIVLRMRLSFWLTVVLAVLIFAAVVTTGGRPYAELDPEAELRRANEEEFVMEIISDLDAYASSLPQKTLEKPIHLPQNMFLRAREATLTLKPYQYLELPDLLPGNLANSGKHVHRVWSPPLSPAKGLLVRSFVRLELSFHGDRGIAELDLQNIDLSNGSLSGIDARSINFSSSRLCGTSMLSANFMDANFSFCDLRDADFNSSVLAGALLRHTNLKNAYLGGAFVDKGWIEKWKVAPDGPTGVVWDHWSEQEICEADAAIYSSPPSVTAKRVRQGILWTELARLELRPGLDAKTLYPTVSANR